MTLSEIPPLPYILRLACLCLQSLFLINLAAALLCAALSSRLTRRASTLRPANAARLFLTLRLLPFATALLVVAGLCIPSYLRYEQNTGSESTGWFCLLAAALGLGLCLTTLYRSIRALLQLRSIHQQTKQLRTQPSALAPTPLCIADPNTAGAPLLSLVGILTPRLIVSPHLLQTLSADQLDAALAHEQAHLLSRDNLKRLLIAITPRPTALRPSPPLHRAPLGPLRRARRRRVRRPRPSPPRHRPRRSPSSGSPPRQLRALHAPRQLPRRSELRTRPAHRSPHHCGHLTWPRPPPSQSMETCAVSLRIRSGPRSATHAAPSPLQPAGVAAALSAAARQRAIYYRW